MEKQKLAIKKKDVAPAKAIDKDEKKMSQLLKKYDISNMLPKIGDIVKGIVIDVSRAGVVLDINGIFTGRVRGKELYPGEEKYANLKPGDKIESTVVESENENGELELSFRCAGEQKAIEELEQIKKENKTIEVKALQANKGGLVISYGQINGFLPVSQLSPENYPRVQDGDKTKILEHLKKFIGKKFKVKIIEFNLKEEKLIVSQKLVWIEKQKQTISKYKVGNVVEGEISAVANFGIFINFDESLEGLIHISELSWQRIDDPAKIFSVGQKIKAEIIGIDGAKIFLSIKKLAKDPWKGIEKKYKIDQKVKGKILKINPFGLFVQLDKNIHGLAHISSLGLKDNESIEKFKIGKEYTFYITSINEKEHRLGLKGAGFEPKSL